MRFVVKPDGGKFMVEDTMDPDGNITRIRTKEQAEKIAARLRLYYPSA